MEYVNEQLNNGVKPVEIVKNFIDKRNENGTINLSEIWIG